LIGRPRIALLWHAAEDELKARRARLDGVFRALEALGAAAEPVVYADETAGAARERLLQRDGVLVWVNPITDGRDRSVLDALLREVAASGVWVSAHPDVVSTLGTKEVLYRTRTLGWGSDVRLHEDRPALHASLVTRLASGPLVLKRARGNGGLGVWKVELATAGAPPDHSRRVTVRHAHDDATEELDLDVFVDGFRAYFDGGGRVVEQPFLPRAAEGMVRCYLSGSRVVGFAEHLPKGLVSPASAAAVTVRGAPLGEGKVMCDATEPAFRSLRDALESEWVPGLRRLLGLDAARLPAIWDADFLRGARTPVGEDAWVLCEINASCVSPFPESAAEPIARTALAAVSRRAER
jgi:hypothetical protein